MSNTELEQELAAAEATVAFAQSVRALHARKTQRGDPQRQADIDLALERIKDTMKPIRSRIGRYLYGFQSEAMREQKQLVLRHSRALQAERRKLWKLKQVPK